MEKKELAIDFISIPDKPFVCVGEKMTLQAIVEEGSSVSYFDWYKWEIDGNYDWDIEELNDQHQLINPVYLGRSGSDGKITIYPEETAVYTVTGFCNENQYIIVNVAPYPQLFFTENDDIYKNEETGIFTLRICANDETFTLPCYKTLPAIGSGPEDVDALYYKIYRIDENKENKSDYLKKGVLLTNNTHITDIPSILTQEDIMKGVHTENYVIEISLTENPEENECISRNYFNVRNISNKAVWSPQPGNTDNWNYDGNWKVYTSSAIYDIQVLPQEAGVPMACTEVMIQGTSKWYPDLKSEEDYSTKKRDALIHLPSDYNFIPQPTCNTITFEMGGKLGNQHHLEYKKAYIEYNFGYYDANNNLLNGKPSSQIMTRDRFYTITIPLRDMVIGDFSFGGKPNAYSRYAEIIRDTQTEGLDANIEMTDPIPYYNVELKPGFGFAYEVTCWGDTEIQSQKNINRTRGVVRLPNFEYEKDGMTVENYGQNHHNAWDKITSTNTFYYFLWGCPNHRLPSLKDTKQRCKWEGDKGIYAGYRFISEQIYAEGTDAGSVSIKSPKRTAHILVGNPLFSYIDFDLFYQYNSNTIHNYYYIYNGEQILAYDPCKRISTQAVSSKNGNDFYDESINANGLIAPSQAFFVDPIVEGSEFQINLNAAMTKVNPQINEPTLRSGSDNFNTLKITAENSD
ncbi:hypothetical protein LJB92_04605, partial [Bacteroidales bacterium OttesenSCG-928-M06]|nr:hypothetical protein [Bacteroidales bacterium OttesenSCG-928-M06]